MPLSSFPGLQVVIQALNSSTEFCVALSGNLLTVANFLFTTVFNFPVKRTQICFNITRQSVFPFLTECMSKVNHLKIKIYKKWHAGLTEAKALVFIFS